MEKSKSLFQEIIDNHNTKKANKPKYEIQNLYCAQLVLNKGLIKVNGDSLHVMEKIKNVILEKIDDFTYRHIKSGKEFSISVIHGIGLHNVKPIFDVYSEYTIYETPLIGLKLSRQQILDKEAKLNPNYTPTNYAKILNV